MEAEKLVAALGLKTGVPFSAKGQKLADSVLTVVSMSKIHVVAGHNPRGANVGDLAELNTSVKKEGMLQTVVVSPTKQKKGHFDLIMGERRLRSLKAAGRKDVAVIVRLDAATPTRRLALAMAENSEDARQGLNPIQQGRAFERLQKGSMTAVEIAKVTGTHESRVRRCLALMKTDKAIQKKVEEGNFPVIAAVELSKAPPEQRSGILESVPDIPSQAEVRAAVKKAATAAGAKPSDKAMSKHVAPTTRAASMVNWKGSKEKSAVLAEAADLYVNTPADARDTMLHCALRGICALLLWERGNISTWYVPFDKDEETDLTKEEAAKLLKNFDTFVKIWAGKHDPDATD